MFRVFCTLMKFALRSSAASITSTFDGPISDVGPATSSNYLTYQAEEKTFHIPFDTSSSGLRIHTSNGSRHWNPKRTRSVCWASRRIQNENQICLLALNERCRVFERTFLEYVALHALARNSCSIFIAGGWCDSKAEVLFMAVIFARFFRFCFDSSLPISFWALANQAKYEGTPRVIRIAITSHRSASGISLSARVDLQMRFRVIVRSN